MISIPISRRKIKKNIILRILKRIRREIEWVYIKTGIHNKKLKNKYPINTPGEVIRCNTSSINNIIFKINDEDSLNPLSLEEDGNWDEKFVKIKDLNIYKALYEFIKNDKSFKETNFYNPNIKTKEEWENNSTWEYISEYDYEKRVNKIRNLVNDIKLNGYKNQTSLRGNFRDEIIVKIGRNGQIFLSDGIHRFCIASILGIDEIPIIIKTRHKEWVKFKNQLYYYALTLYQGTKNEGKLYQRLTHPDLQDIPYIHTNDDRFSAILKNRISDSGTVLDIGANLGFFSGNLAMLGYKCTAVEQNNQLIYFLDKLNQVNGNNFTIVHGDILRIFETQTEFDIVLALNIFHHFLKTESDYNKFVRLLNNLKMKEMFFEPHNPNEGQFIGAFKNLNNEEFIKLIIDNTNLNKYEKILDCFENRNLYHLWC